MRCPTFRLGDDLVFLVDAFARNDERNVAAHRLLGGIAEETLGRAVPASDGAVERLADDGVIRRLDDRREQAGGQQLVRLVTLHAALLGHVAEDQHASRDVAAFVADRRGAVVDRTFATVLPNQHRVIRQPDDDSLSQRLRCRTLNRPASVLVDDPKDAVEWPPQGIRLRPAGQRFGHGIHIRDAAIDVGGDDSVADAVQRDAQQLAPLAGSHLGAPRCLTESDDQGTGEEIGQQPDQVSKTSGAQAAARLDEQVTTGDVSQNRHDNGRTDAAQPHGRGDGPEQRDERQRVAHQRVDQVAQEYRSDQGGNRERVGCRRAAYHS